MSAQMGAILWRVDGEFIDDGSETYQGMHLVWTSWRVVKVTPRGAWLQCVGHHWKKQRFALIPGARWVSATREEALRALIARKRRHLDILENQKTCASETLVLAKAALVEVGAVEVLTCKSN